jgi:hypothetical protein
LPGTSALRESQQREAAIFFQKAVSRTWKEVDDACWIGVEVVEKDVLIVLPAAARWVGVCFICGEVP